MVSEKKLLTIIIPTYNRSKLLDVSLRQMNELRKMFLFDLIVCNNASTDDTSHVLRMWEKHITNFRVVNHKENIFYDRNVASGYMLVETDYCWVLGDSNIIEIQDMKKVMAMLEYQKPQALIINDSWDSIKNMDCVYTDANSLLHDLGWYTTLLCSCIIHKDFLSKERCERYYDSGFIHEGVFYDYLAFLEKVKVYLLPSVHIKPILMDKSGTSWRKTPFLVFGKKWYAFIMSLPYKYSLENKLYCIKQHEAHRHIFSPRLLLKNKWFGYTSFSDYDNARFVLKYVFRYPLFITDIISKIPSLGRFKGNKTV